MTLLELIVAATLSSVVMLALVRLIDSATQLWTKGEQRRAVLEQASATAELLARDLRALHGGSRGDLLVDWYPHDVERDGRVERVWPRLRFVRSAAPVDLARLEARAAAEAVRAERARLRSARLAAQPGARAADDVEGELSVAEVLAAQRRLHQGGADALARPDTSTGGATRGRTGPDLDPVDPLAQPPVDLAGIGLMEVAWVVVPRGSKGEARYEGVLLRAERLLKPGEATRLLAGDFFDKSGRPAAELVEEVTGGVLWCDVRLATQTTTLDAARPDGGWALGRDITSAASSWDAFGLARPNPDLHFWNEPPPGMPQPGVLPLLPRRVRLELEIERERDLARRPRLVDAVEEDEVSLTVNNGDLLRDVIGGHVLVDGEWLKVKSLSRDTVYFERAQRGTERRRLAAGALVHFGEPLVVEVPVVLHRDEWTIGRQGLGKDTLNAGSGR